MDQVALIKGKADPNLTHDVSNLFSLLQLFFFLPHFLFALPTSSSLYPTSTGRPLSPSLPLSLSLIHPHSTTSAVLSLLGSLWSTSQLNVDHRLDLNPGSRKGGRR